MSTVASAIQGVMLNTSIRRGKLHARDCGDAIFETYTFVGEFPCGAVHHLPGHYRLKSTRLS